MKFQIKEAAFLVIIRARHVVKLTIHSVFLAPKNGTEMIFLIKIFNVPANQDILKMVIKYVSHVITLVKHARIHNINAHLARQLH
jgi:hypothetical protein